MGQYNLVNTQNDHAKDRYHHYTENVPRVMICRFELGGQFNLGLFLILAIPIVWDCSCAKSEVGPKVKLGQK